MEAVGMVLKSLKTVCLACERLAAVRTGVGALPRVRLQVPAQVLLVLKVGDAVDNQLPTDVVQCCGSASR